MAKQTTKATKETTKADINKLSKIYDKDYYENGIATNKSNYVNYSWDRLEKYFQRTANYIKEVFSPATVLDVGCAKGYLVKALTELNIDAKGIDPSKYAISEADEDIKDLLQNDIVQAIKYDDNSFDLVTCFDVMEHIPEKDIDKAINEMLRITKKWLVIRLVTKRIDNDIDNSHETIHEKEWWHERITKAGGIIEPAENYTNKAVWWFNVSEFLIVVRKAV